MADRLVLIDFSSIARPIYEAGGNSPNVDQVSIDIIGRIRALTSEDKHAALCLDSGRSFRHDISADYKAQRPETPQAYLRQCALALDVLRGDGYPVWQADGFEADDLLASATGRAIPDFNVLIVTGDKDMHQLVSQYVSVLRPANGKNPAITYDADSFEVQHAGLKPSQIVDYLALVGDQSDNVKGADGVGPKRAAVLLQEFGNLDDLYRAMDEGKAFTPALTKALLDFYPRMTEVRSLLTLRTDVALPFEEILKERQPVDVPQDDMMADINEAMPTLDYSKQEPLTSTEVETVNQYLRDKGMPTPSPAAQNAAMWPDLGKSATNGAEQPSSLVVREPEHTDWQRELEPRSMNEAKELSTAMFASRLFSAYGHPAGIMATVLAGREIGMQAMTALRAFHIIDGRPTLSAGAIHAMVLRSGQAEYFRCAERTNERCTFVTKRRGEPEQSLTFTLEDARMAWAKDDAAWKKSGYGRNPADMLVARTSTKLARLVYPDVVHNLYAPEEMEGA